MRRQHQNPTQALRMAASPVRPSYQDTQWKHARQPADSLSTIITCKAQVNGMQVDSVVDTGTATSAITLDCLRRLNLDSLIDPTTNNYINADGCMSAGKGKVPNLVLSLGGFSTLISPTVTTALDYDMLIGNDILYRARAVIDYNKGSMLVQVDPTLSQVIDISMTTPDASACYAVEAFANQVSAPDATYMMLDGVTEQPSFSCAAATGQPSMDDGMDNCGDFSGLWNPSLDDDSGMDAEGPSVCSSPAAASASHQASRLQPHTAAHMEETAATHQSPAVDGSSTAPSTTAGESVSLGPLSAAERADLMQFLREGYTHLDPTTACEMAELDIMRFEFTIGTDSLKSMQDSMAERFSEAETCVAASTLMLPAFSSCAATNEETDFPDARQLLTSGYNPDLHSASQNVPPPAEAAVATDDNYAVPIHKLDCLHTMSSLRQGNAQMCQGARTVFDPGGCLPVPSRILLGNAMSAAHSSQKPTPRHTRWAPLN